MSYGYSIVCIACKEEFSLGKAIRYDENMEEIPWQFGGTRNLGGEGWLKGASLWPFVERFLLLHRGHELTVLTERVMDRALDELGHDLDEHYPPSTIFEVPLDPEPDPYEDVDRIDPGVLRRLVTSTCEDERPQG